MWCESHAPERRRVALTHNPAFARRQRVENKAVLVIKKIGADIAWTG